MEVLGRGSRDAVSAAEAGLGSADDEIVYAQAVVQDRVVVAEGAPLALEPVPVMRRADGGG